MAANANTMRGSDEEEDPPSEVVAFVSDMFQFEKDQMINSDGFDCWRLVCLEQLN
jgi:hypothetical protein